MDFNCGDAKDKEKIDPSLGKHDDDDDYDDAVWLFLDASKSAGMSTDIVHLSDAKSSRLHRLMFAANQASKIYSARLVFYVFD